MPRSASQAGGRISLDVYRIPSALMSDEIGEPVDDSIYGISTSDDRRWICRSCWLEDVKLMLRVSDVYTVYSVIAGIWLRTFR